MSRQTRRLRAIAVEVGRVRWQVSEAARRAGLHPITASKLLELDALLRDAEGLAHYSVGLQTAADETAGKAR